MYKLRTVTVAVQFALAAMSGRAKAQVKRSRNVKNARVGALAVAALFASAVNAGEVNGPVSGLELVVQAWTGGAEIDWSPAAGIQSLNLTSSLVLDPTTGDIKLADGAQTHFDSFTTMANGSSVVSIDLLLTAIPSNVDPIISYGLQVVNNGANVATFQRINTSPILPTLSGPTQVRAGLSGSVSDIGGGGVTITPNQQAAVGQDPDGIAEMQVFRLRQTVGSGAWTNAGVDVGAAQTFSGGGAPFTYTYGPTNLPYQAGPTAATSWAQMQTVTRFSLTGGGDRATLVGFAEILPVPEPGEYALMLAGLAVVAGVARRRRISLS